MVRDENETATDGGGTVANCYKYPAYQTVACGIKRNDNVYLALGVKSASKGTSNVPKKVGLITKQLNKWSGNEADLIIPIDEAYGIISDATLN